MRAAVVRDDIQATFAHPVDDTHRTAAIVGDAMKIDDRASTRSGPTASPTFQIHAVAGECRVRASAWRDCIEMMTCRMQQSAGAGCCQLTWDRCPADEQHGHEKDDGHHRSVHCVAAL